MSPIASGKFGESHLFEILAVLENATWKRSAVPSEISEVIHMISMGRVLQEIGCAFSAMRGSELHWSLKLDTDHKSRVFYFYF